MALKILVYSDYACPFCYREESPLAGADIGCGGVAERTTDPSRRGPPHAPPRSGQTRESFRTVLGLLRAPTIKSWRESDNRLRLDHPTTCCFPTPSMRT